MSAANEREEFSKRLKQKLRELGIEPLSATRLAHGFNDRFPAHAISAQAARKWLGAEAIPGQAKLKALATWLEVGPEWLRFGQGRRRGDDSPPVARAIPDRVIRPGASPAVPEIEK